MNAVRGVDSAPSPRCSEDEEEFDEAGPRPPTLPGKEEQPKVTRGLHHHQGGGHHHHHHRRSPSPPPHHDFKGGGGGRTFSGSPSALTPRKSSYRSGRLSEMESAACSQARGAESDGEPPLGYEPEGSARGATPQLAFWESAASASSTSAGRTPPYLRWAMSLRELLRDGEGVALFKRYLQIERCEDSLDFWFACEGLKKQAQARTAGAPDHLPQLIKVIYRKFLRSHGAVSIGTVTRRTIVDKVSGALGGSGVADCSIFDGAQREVEEHISKSTYPNFLKSDLYLQFVQGMQQQLQNGHHCASAGGGSPPSPRHGDGSTAASSAGCSVSSSRSSSSSGGGRPDYGVALPTVMEDCELSVGAAGGGGVAGGAPLPLTSRHLMATQRSRARFSETRQPEAFAGMYLKQSSHSVAPNPYHAMYSSFIPASAQDSELQSLSSGAHTDETVSLTDSSVDGAPIVFNRKRMQQQQKAINKNASQNYDPLSHHTVIPRPQQHQVNVINPRDTEVFAAFIIEKLEEVKRKQECEERMGESLRKLEYEENRSFTAASSGRPDDPPPQQWGAPAVAMCGSADPLMAPIQSALLSVAMRKQILDDDQSILDDHVSRIWDDSAHGSPARSPGLQSPAPPAAVPFDRRRVSAPSHLTSRRGVRDRDGASLASGDSGAVPDFVNAEVGASRGFAGVCGGPPLVQPVGHHHRYYHSGKSKMIGEPIDMPPRGHLDMYGAAATGSAQAEAAQQRRSRGGEVCSGGKVRLGSKKVQESSDSGVSVAYESSQPAPGFDSQEKVMSWVLDSKKYYGPGDPEKEASSSRHKRSTISTVSPGPSRQGSRGKKPAAYSSSRSGSLERGGHSAWGTNPLPQPSQPFMTNPAMPILPPPNTITQLEEARRRLEDDGKNKPSKSRSGMSSKDRAPYSDQGKSSSRSFSGKLPMYSATSVETFVDENPSNLKKSGSKKPAGSQSTPSISALSAAPSASTDTNVPADYTVVLYNFSGESVPYRSKLAGKNIVLRQFKSLITKKGNFRYFFKSQSDDVDTGFVYEEASDDSELLPLWDGKIFALLESID